MQSNSDTSIHYPIVIFGFALLLIAKRKEERVLTRERNKLVLLNLVFCQTSYTKQGANRRKNDLII